ncbi:iron chaperone [Terrabacter aeriphilus]|uniref:Iron chaperone n=1 Tax=Terrabacter aeriphilus TaxID=515662 RepID=A0ABP9JB37_9MICO
MGTVEDYLSGLPPEQAQALRRVVELSHALAPDAEEGTSYGMPALLVGGRPLVGITAAVRHLSLFPFSSAVVAAVAPDLEGYSLSKGTIRFTVEQPLPDAVVEQVVRLRRAELGV